MATRQDCGNFDQLGTVIKSDFLARQHPLSHKVTTRCAGICGTVQADCVQALNAPDDCPASKEGQQPDEMAVAAQEIRLFLATEVNPIIARVKAGMAVYADNINDMIDSGAPITPEVQAFYKSVGFSRLKDVIEVIEAKSMNSNGNIFYKGFLRMLAHRLGSQVMLVTCYSEMDLIRAAKGDAGRDRFTDHYTRLQLFNLSEKELELHEWNPYDLLSSAEQSFEAQLIAKGRSGIEVRKRWKDSKVAEQASAISYVNVHQKIFDEALVELMRNAERAIGEGEIVTDVKIVDGHVVFSVKDNGVGIDPEVLPRIFDNGFTTRASAGGTGKGLALVYDYIKRIGGRIEVESAVGQGSTFSIWLPLANNSSQEKTA